jgi:hypothetical protein
MFTIDAPFAMLFKSFLLKMDRGVEIVKLGPVVVSIQLELGGGYFRIARQPGAIAITSYKPTYQY